MISELPQLLTVKKSFTLHAHLHVTHRNVLDIRNTMTTWPDLFSTNLHGFKDFYSKLDLSTLGPSFINNQQFLAQSILNEAFMSQNFKPFSQLTNLVWTQFRTSSNELVGNNFELLMEEYPQFYTQIGLYALGEEEADTLYDDLSTPDSKLYYPEPFVASPSFVHDDIWFLHILLFQHWLWFFFITLIMFFFITFINTVRWCNARTRPKRETRGVSRSKCADLITACVPVSWAASIIITESVDASDYYDGYGTGVIILGIRAYQWGWQYYYPTGLRWNYNVNNLTSNNLGNSLRYTATTDKHSNTVNLWRRYRFDQPGSNATTSTNTILSPSDNNKLLDFINLDDIGVNTLKDSQAFKKIQKFSKLNINDLVVNNTDLYTRYSKITNLYLNETNLINSHTYSIARQGLYLTNNSNCLKTQNLFENNLDKTLSTYNLNLDLLSKTNSLYPRTSILKNYTNQDIKLQCNIARITSLNSLTSKNNPLSTNTKLNPIQYLISTLKLKPKKSNLITESPIYNPSQFNIFNNSKLGYTSTSTYPWDLSPYSNNTTPLNLGESLSFNFTDLQSMDKSIPNNSFKNLKTSECLQSLNINSFNNRSLLSVKSLTNLGPNPNSFLGKSLLNEPTNHILGSNVSISPQASPVYSTSLTEIHDNPSLSYWATYWANSISQNKYDRIKGNLNVLNSVTLPSITDYVDYDFKNWQSLELLEDLTWDSTYSITGHEDFLTNNLNLTKAQYFNLQNLGYNKIFRFKKFQFNKIYPKITKVTVLDNYLNHTSLDNLETFNSNPLSLLKTYKDLTNEDSLSTGEDSYDAYKSLTYLLNHSQVQNINLDTLNLTPLNYTQILNSFRSDFEDSNWSSDYNTENLDLSTNNFSKINQLRLNNPFKLRSTGKNSIVTYNAMQKVFKSRFDEGRSNSRLEDIANSYNPYLFINEGKINYEHMLSKNSNNFVDTTNYTNHIKNTFSNMYEMNNLLNTYLIDIPFLKSAISDSARYLWHDWDSRWVSIEVQPSSIARYSLSGVPYTLRSSEYNPQESEEFNDSENYLNRLGRSRKNYMTSWAYTPYLYNKLAVWNQNTNQVETLFNPSELINLRYNLKLSLLYWNTSKVLSTGDKVTPSYSLFNTPGRSFNQSIGNISSYTYQVNSLVDILTKREYLYRKYLQGRYINNWESRDGLPSDLKSTPTNNLLREIKSSFRFYDPSTFSSEASRSFFYQNKNLINLLFIRDILTGTLSIRGDNSLIYALTNNLLFYYFISNTDSDNLKINTTLLKNQYRPMRKGLTNMIRLQATGVVAVPVDVRVHILASSKDVIHSWAIPSAGIKIDCVPGYSSHRTSQFLNLGLYWGQCMEICGRFHHWMPIALYCIKMDMFSLWVLDFQLYNPNNNRFISLEEMNSFNKRYTSHTASNWNRLTL